jgi:protein SCO1/2
VKKFYQAVSVLALAVLLAACGKVETPQQKFSTADITGAPWGNDFRLTDHRGQQRTMADFKGKAVVLFFGYANCPDMCPMTMYKLSQVMEKLGKDAERVQVLMVTLDPKRDTPEVLKQYVPAFHPSFIGLYGDGANSERVQGIL